MSRIKSRTQSDVCGDCGAADPSWASVNHGILLCSECCSIHRSLGRHISLVKSLRQGTWPPAVFSFVQLLNTNGANSVWEHCLLDPIAPKGLRRKPTPKDPLHPNKADFIRAKHVNLAFVLKPNLKQFEDNSGGVAGLASNSLEIELSKQLRASVRSPNLETSLRLLVQGANPNYYHEEKGSMPLHVAAKSGQAAQIELLIVFGADLAARDGAGQTAIEIAKQNNHFVIADRLMEAAYEVTDRLCGFLGAAKIDHASGKHLHIPEQQTTGVISEQLKIARGKLQLIPNKIFEELVMDVFDEIDRREMEAIWATTALNPEVGAVPFLPTNPHLSATRNQGRQKLARFSPIEFAGLVTDVLLDAQRRQNMATLRPIVPSSTMLSLGLANPKGGLSKSHHPHGDDNLSDDEPLYDAVASDDDYATLAPVTKKPQNHIHNTNANHTNTALHKTMSAPASSGAEVEHLRKKLLQSFSEIDELKSMVQQLSFENYQLKSRIEPETPTDTFDVPLRIDLQTGPTPDGACSAADHHQLPHHRSSHIVHGSHLNTTAPTTTLPSTDETTETEPVSDSRFAKRPVSMFEPREGIHNTHKALLQNMPESRTTSSMYQMADAAKKQQRDQTLPVAEEVKHRTDIVTRRIQELWTVMQDQVRDAFVPCAERIRVAIEELTAIFPQAIPDETIKGAMRQLTQSTATIQNECTRLQRALSGDDQTLIDICMQDVRNSAYNLAMATKMLVTQFS